MYTVLFNSCGLDNRFYGAGLRPVCEDKIENLGVVFSLEKAACAKIDPVGNHAAITFIFSKKYFYIICLLWE